MESSNLNLLKDLANEVYFAVHPLLGVKKASEIVGSGFCGDKTSLIDVIAEKAVIRYLRQNEITCVFFGEENGIKKIGKKPDFYIIVDAVDGTTNSLRGIKFVSASLAISKTKCFDSLESSVVINLYDGSIYEAERGKGAYYRNKRIHTSNIQELQESIISIDISGVPERVESVIPIMKKSKYIRSLGSAALEICHVASGKIEAYVDIRNKLRTVDIAAGMLILKEAGGTVLQLDGKEFIDNLLVSKKRFSIITAANNYIYNQVISSIPLP
jgi:myo-inositol-1(or 4)-monophosphatase